MTNQVSTFYVKAQIPNVMGKTVGIVTPTPLGFYLPSQRSVHSKKSGYVQDGVARSTTLEKTSSSQSASTARSTGVSPSTNNHFQQKSNKGAQKTHVFQSSGTDKTSSVIAASGSIDERLQSALSELDEIKQQYQKGAKLSSNQEKPFIPSQEVSSNKQNIEKIPATKEIDTKEQQLRVAELVMQKLYKKNIQLEKDLNSANETIKQLKESNQPSTVFSSLQPQYPAAPKETQSLIKAPPTLESVNSVANEADNYLRFLVEEQDRTIADLRAQNELLQTQLQHVKGSIKSSKSSASQSQKPQIIPKLQKKLSEALQESQRQKSNYQKMKEDYKHLLQLRTRTLSGDSKVNEHAKDLIDLMSQRLERQESERERDIAAYNMKLYDAEQDNGNWYVEKRMMEQEFKRLEGTVKDRDSIDSKIEKCMYGVFERLRELEMENLRLRGEDAN